MDRNPGSDLPENLGLLEHVYIETSHPKCERCRQTSDTAADDCNAKRTRHFLQTFSVRTTDRARLPIGCDYPGRYATHAFRHAHVQIFVARAKSSIITSRIANFWTLPVTVDGKLSTNRMWRGDSFGRSDPRENLRAPPPSRPGAAFLLDSPHASFPPLVSV